MKPSLLKSGQRVVVVSDLGAPREMIFLRRLRPGREIPLGQGAECLFRCEDFRGLNGPEDPGLCTMTDARVVRTVRLAPAA